MSSSLDSQQNSNVIQANHAHNNHAQQSNYTHWINTHLKKRPGVKLIENLQIDIINGVALIHLIEVICKCFELDFFICEKALKFYFI